MDKNFNYMDSFLKNKENVRTSIALNKIHEDHTERKSCVKVLNFAFSPSSGLKGFLSLRSHIYYILNQSYHEA